MNDVKPREDRRIPVPYPMEMRSILILLALAAPSLVACGGASYAYSREAAGSAAGEPVQVAATGGDYGPVAPAEEMEIGVTADAPQADSGGGMGGGTDYYDQVEEGEPAAGPTTTVTEDRARYAEASPQPTPQRQTPAATPRPAAGEEATDAASGSGPLLIYTGTVTLAVYEVEQTQDRILESLTELEGFLAHRTNAELVVRVPAARFERALALIEEAGDVLDRNIEVQDVSEEFRDLQIRIQNAEAMRDRLEQLLSRADDVEGALAIERELQRLTDFIERAKGRQRFLSDRISFSTITVYFRPLATEPTGPDGFNLPFDWLGELGLSTLLRL